MEKKGGKKDLGYVPEENISWGKGVMGTVPIYFFVSY